MKRLLIWDIILLIPFTSGMFLIGLSIFDFVFVFLNMQISLLRFVTDICMLSLGVMTAFINYVLIRYDIIPKETLVTDENIITKETADSEKEKCKVYYFSNYKWNAFLIIHNIGTLHCPNISGCNQSESSPRLCPVFYYQAKWEKWKHSFISERAQIPKRLIPFYFQK